MVEIIQNFLSKEEQNKIENLFFSNNFPWFYNAQTVYDDLHKGYFFKDKNTVDGLQFNHIFIDNYQINSNYCANLTSLMFYFAVKTNVKIDKSIRIKANLTLPEIDYNDKFHKPAHYDTLDKNVITAIYYVNDSDGDTIFFADPKNKKNSNVDELQEIKRVTPKKGQMVYFKSNILHANALNKKTKHRCVINFNFIQ